MISSILSLLVIFIATVGNTLFGFSGGLFHTRSKSDHGDERGGPPGLVSPGRHRFPDPQNGKGHRLASGQKTLTIPFLGIAVGTLVLEKAEIVFLNLFLAVFIYGFLLKARFFPDMRFGMSATSKKIHFIGVLSGSIAGLTGTPGPVLLMLLSELSQNPLAVRANLIALLFVINITRLTAAVSRSLFSEALLALAFLSLPVIGLAMFTGQRIHSSVSSRSYNNAVQVVLLISATLLVIKTVGDM